MRRSITEGGRNAPGQEQRIELGWLVRRQPVQALEQQPVDWQPLEWQPGKRHASHWRHHRAELGSTGSSSARTTRSTGARAAKSASAGASQAASAADARVEAVAQRVRKLNERIIEESKSAGEATLTAYEKALKAIASSLERGPGKSDVEWISSLATTQAKWIRDVTSAWTSAARGMLK